MDIAVKHLAPPTNADRSGQTGEPAILYKLQRLKRGLKGRVIDLFSGCGGLSLGFKTAGFDILSGVELDKDAARTFAHNFFSQKSPYFERAASSRDMRTLTPRILFKDIGVSDPVHLAVDIVVGGPPCQVFARIGRAKLKTLETDGQAWHQDDRVNLSRRYLRWISMLKPLAVVMENVPDSINFRGRNIADEVCKKLEKLGYNCQYSLLNAVHFGVPQIRERMFLVGIHQDAREDFVFPSKTHAYQLPRGYTVVRSIALRGLQGQRKKSRYIDSQDLIVSLNKATSSKEAISDLPGIFAERRAMDGSLSYGAQRFDTAVSYKQSATVYSRLMRQWPGYKSEGTIVDHVIRFLPMDYDLFRDMDPDEEYPDLFKKRVEMIDERYRSYCYRYGCIPDRRSQGYRNLVSKLLPRYSNEKFANKWWKLHPDKPVRTLTAHLGKDCYSHIHYSRSQARTISVREAARLQSFPDGFRFPCAMGPAFRQIGNSVPPLMSYAFGLRFANMFGLINNSADFTKWR